MSPDIPKTGEFAFLVSDGSAKLSGWEYDFQEPTLWRESTVRRENLSGESRGDTEEFNLKNQKMTRKSKMTFGLFEVISFIVILLNPEFQFSEPKEESFPIPLKFFDVTRSTLSDLDVAKNTNRRLLECRRKEKSVRFMDRFHEIYVLKRNSSKKIHVGRGETDKDSIEITSRSHMAWRLDENNQNSIMPDIEENLFYWSERQKNTRTSFRVQGESWKHQWQQQSHANDFFKADIRETVVPKTRKARASDAKQDSAVSLKHMNPRDKESN